MPEMASDQMITLSAEPRQPWRTMVLWLVGLELVVLYAPTVRFLYERWTFSVWHNAHGMFIPFIVAYLAYQELKPFAGRPCAASAWGWVWTAAALLMQALDAGMHSELLSAASIVVLLPGLSLLLLGAERTRAIAFPLVFMLFALPIPLSFTETLHWELRQVVVFAIERIVPMLGVPVFTVGTEVHLANGVLQIADACSGFSTLYAAAAVACLVAYTASTAARSTLVLAAAAPIAVASNILRVTLLVLLTYWYGPHILETWIHPFSGMMTFALALPVIFWLGGAGPHARRA